MNNMPALELDLCSVVGNIGLVCGTSTYYIKEYLGNIDEIRQDVIMENLIKSPSGGILNILLCARVCYSHLRPWKIKISVSAKRASVERVIAW